MAYFGSEGLGGTFATGAARGGPHVAGATVAGGSYATGGQTTESKAPWSEPVALPSRAGDGQRFPFTSRQTLVVQDVLLADDEGALILE